MGSEITRKKDGKRGKAKSDVGFWKYASTKMKTRTGVAELAKGNDQGMTKTDEEKANVLCDYFTEVFTEEDIAKIPDAQLHCAYIFKNNIYMTLLQLKVE